MVFGGVGRDGEGGDTGDKVCEGGKVGGFGELGEDGGRDGGEVGGGLPESCNPG